MGRPLDDGAARGWGRAVAVVAMACGALSAPGGARAQSGGSDAFALELFEPMPGQGLNLLNVSESAELPHLGLTFGLFTHYADDPLTLVDTESRDFVTARPLDHQVVTEVSAGIGFGGFSSLSVVMPLALSQDGTDLALFGRPGETVDSFAVGDLRVIPKVRVLDPADTGGFGLHVVVPVWIPTGDAGSFRTDEAVRVQPTLGVDFRTEDGLVVALNGGYQIRPERVAHNYVSDDQIRWALGLRVPTAPWLNLIASVYGSHGLGEATDPESFETPLEDGVSTAVEAMGALEFTVAEMFVVTAGGGGALVHGVGTPDARAFIGLAYTPLAEVVGDADGDGILDTEDKCPEAAEDVDGFEDADGCPDADNDGDGIPDVADACPGDAEDMDGFDDADGCPEADNDDDGVPDAEDACPTTAEDADGFEDEDGCPDADNDGDGIPDTIDKCPGDAEDVDGFEDEDGCPEPDNDGDTVPDATDRCPTRAESLNGFEDDDGCPDTALKDVRLTDTAIETVRRIGFVGKTDVLPGSIEKTLESVATVMRENPWITGLRVEAHTDSAGLDVTNTALTQTQAEAVVAFLVAQGVDKARLTAKGMGEDRPAVSNATPSGRTRNRRIEFYITSIDGKPVTAPAER